MQLRNPPDGWGARGERLRSPRTRPITTERAGIDRQVNALHAPSPAVKTSTRPGHTSPAGVAPVVDRLQQSYERKERRCTVGSQEKLLCVLSREGCDKWGCFEPVRVSLLLGVSAAAGLNDLSAALAESLAAGPPFSSMGVRRGRIVSTLPVSLERVVYQDFCGHARGWPKREGRHPVGAPGRCERLAAEAIR
jgi:hypothetical protein